MTSETLFRTTFTLFTVLAIGTRVFLRSRAALRSEGKDSPREPGWQLILQLLLGLAGMALLAVYIIYPASIAIAQIPLPGWLRWSGLIPGLAGVALLAWTHLTLDRNFSGTLQIETDHRLMTEGPYALIRHPMYTALIGVALCWALLSANAALGLLWIGTMLTLFLPRMPKEEAMLISHFGDEYRAYMARTGRLLPRLWRRAVD